MNSRTHAEFWSRYNDLPPEVRRLAQSAYRLFRQDPFHASLQFKPAKGHRNLYSVRIGLKYRALGTMTGINEITWFWIGTHDEYDTLLR
ncbi:MAG: hypothetical protein L6Q98_16135 [Anaerolineae bacterium]|nr:hypothetical protein [Anaerolineae bacterium]NUQ04721.1 hypothetical protein [Anaerolineae bacterium]